MDYFSVIVFCGLCVSFGASDDILLRPEHGVAFEKVGLIANDMTIWHQTFIIPLSKLDITLTRLVIRPEKRAANNTSEYTCVAATLMNDYQSKTVELRATYKKLKKKRICYCDPLIFLEFVTLFPKILVPGLLVSINLLFEKELHSQADKSALGYHF
jgi:hypothetical protein